MAKIFQFHLRDGIPPVVFFMLGKYPAVYGSNLYLFGLGLVLLTWSCELLTTPGHDEIVESLGFSYSQYMMVWGTFRYWNSAYT